MSNAARIAMNNSRIRAAFKLRVAKHNYKLRIGHYGEGRAVKKWPFVDASHHDVDLSTPEKAEKYAEELLASDTTIEKIVVVGKKYRETITR